MKVIVIGGGAAGFFAAIAAAQRGHQVKILEAAKSVLAKVRISGGGRCNVTHHCFEPSRLAECYPRGGKELRGPFARFQPSDTIEWFESHGVKLKTEADGRMFPTTDDSNTVIHCLLDAASAAGVDICTRENVDSALHSDIGFQVRTKAGTTHQAERLLLATGGTRLGFELASSLGHRILPPVPSLFTFNVRDDRIRGLAGVSVDVASCELVFHGSKPVERNHRQRGPLLITHWGFSGPAVLKLSAWAARELHDCEYRATLRINWLRESNTQQVREQLIACKANSAKRTVDAHGPFALPRRLWQSLVTAAIGNEPVRWAELTKKSIQALASELTLGTFQIDGRSVYKEEFVTCGGVDLKEVDFRTMESRLVSGLYFAGEILDIDGITGGFNFQNAWTTAWVAGNSM